jgi:hypothetical protein
LASFEQHLLSGVSEPRLQNPEAQRVTISALVPVPRAGGFGERAYDAHLKPICSRELLSVAAFCGGTATDGESGSVTSEKGIGEDFGEAGLFRGEPIGSA